MAGELRLLRTSQPNYILIVWQPSQARLRDSGLLLLLTLEGLCLYLIPLCNHTGTEKRTGNISMLLVATIFIAKTGKFCYLCNYSISWKEYRK